MDQQKRPTFTELFDELRWHWRSMSELKATSLFTKANYTNFLLLIFFLVFAVYQARSKVKAAGKSSPNKQYLPAPDFPEIEELPDFSWKDEEPTKLRPFKPKYYLTMVDASALQKLNPSELILMDRTYVERIEYRKKIMKQSGDVALGVNDDDSVRGAVRELYNFLMGTYLPKRYPKVFKLHHAHFETGEMYMLENHATNALVPAQVSKTMSTISLLENLGKTVDEDFLFLQPEETEEGKESEAKYVLQAFVTICPSGWDPREKLGKRLAEIHGPVPGYSKILEGSMDRYFQKVAVGEYVVRSNWNITTDRELFRPGAGSSHAHEGEELVPLDEVDIDETVVRCERQTLHRLPKSKALVFAFKTYQYSIRQIKEEGLGAELADAIDGFKTGNVPGMLFYKRGIEWGDAVKKYLRS